MILGDCPNCGAYMAISIAPSCPAIEEHMCRECEKWIFTYHSRLDPHSYGEGAHSKWPPKEARER